MTTDNATPQWKPLNSRQRRVLGVLVEKAKTVPESYPMTLNSIVTGCNQKSNREPQMDLAADDVEVILEELRALNAVTEVQGSSRVAKYRHHAYEWLGVTAVELAVMTELLLRGEQTLGDLRARAARMESIADQDALRVVVDGLLKKNLMIELTPAGRGQFVTHNLYKERELVELRARFAGNISRPAAMSDDDAPAYHSSAAQPASARPMPPSSPAVGSVRYATADQVAELVVELAELRAEFARLRMQVEELKETLK